jgi:hypothetical protein
MVVFNETDACRSGTAVENVDVRVTVVASAPRPVAVRV